MKRRDPELWLACGISAWVEHLPEMSGSDVIVSVNKDRSAPILEVVDMGLVRDLYEVVAELIKRINELKGDSR